MNQGCAHLGRGASLIRCLHRSMFATRALAADGVILMFSSFVQLLHQRREVAGGAIIACSWIVPRRAAMRPSTLPVKETMVESSNDWCHRQKASLSQLVYLQ